MTVETALYPSQLNASWPAQSDIVREGAGHIRAVKTVLKTTFPNVTGAVSPTQIELNHMVGVTSGVQSQINAKGAIAGQTWTGTHVFPSTTTVGPLTPTIQGYLATVTSDAQAQINGKGAIAGQAWTGVHNFGGASSVALPADTSIGSVSATELSYLDGVTAPIQGQLSGKADTNGESYTGAHDFTGATITAPTKATGTSSNEVATTAFVAATALSAALPGQAGNAGKLLTTDGSNASWGLFSTLEAYGITDALPNTGAIAANGSVRGNKIAVPALDIDCSKSNFFTKTIAANSTFTFSGVPAAPARYAMLVKISLTAGTVTWPASVLPPDGGWPSVSVGKTHLYCFITDDGGASWLGAVRPNYAG